MTGYTKLFASIIASTIWREAKETKIVWITMLAMSDKNGIVEGSIPGLADMARVTVKECQIALEQLLGPDEFSRTQEHEGRRIELVDGGWAILNHAKYRAKMNMDERREYLAGKQREHRAKAKVVNTVSTNVAGASTPSTHTEAEAEAKKKLDELVAELPESLRTVEFTSAWLAWEVHRREIRKKLTPSCKSRQLAKFEKFGPVISAQSIYLAIEKGWTGAFPENINPYGKTNTHQNGGSTRNIGHNANLDYSKRPKKVSTA